MAHIVRVFPRLCKVNLSQKDFHSGEIPPKNRACSSNFVPFRRTFSDQFRIPLIFCPLLADIRLRDFAEPRQPESGIFYCSASSGVSGCGSTAARNSSRSMVSCSRR